MPFRDASVSEIIFRNVLGDPEILDVRYMIKEAARVLKHGGIVKVIEQYSPEAAINYRNQSRVGLFMNWRDMFEPVHEAAGVGFVDETSIDKKMEEFKFNKKGTGSEAFVIRFRKK